MNLAVPLCAARLEETPRRHHMAAAGDGGESHYREALREAFGDSSSSDSDTPAGVSPGAGRGHWRWEAVAGVRGLWLCAAFLSADEQARLLNAIQRGESSVAGTSCSILVPLLARRKRGFLLASCFVRFGSNHKF
jgi:hypothetical protein